MNRFLPDFLLALFLIMSTAPAQTFTVAVNSGNPLVFQKKTGVREPVTQATLMSMGDSLILSAGSQATIGLETNSRLIFKGPGALALTGDSSAAYISFEQGQIFLDRRDPTSFSVLTFWVKNYMFVPSGTAAALRVMNSGMPLVAVIEGKVLMQSPTGESSEILPGKFGTVEQAGRITNGKLGKKAIAALEKWSGVKADPAISDVPVSSLEAVDQEFSTVAAENPASAASPAASKQPAGGVQTISPSSSAAPPEQQPAAPPQDSSAGSRSESGATARGTTFEFSAGAVSIDDQQWTRLSLGMELPVWKFGIFFDLETFLDPQGKFTNKGWNFKDDPLGSTLRKIRYIRFGHEQNPVFVKVGGLTDVTLGHGFIVDRFTNMLHYPDQKLFGLQLYLNDLSPAGITLQVMAADAQELRTRYHGGLGAVRLAFRPLKTSGFPVIGNLSIGGTYAYDRNMYAPAIDWKSTRDQTIVKILNEGVLTDDQKRKLRDSADIDVDAVNDQITNEEKAKKTIEGFGIFGADLTLPLISSPLFSLDLYAQSGMRADSVRGWGIGAPGVAVKIWRLSAAVEYRHVVGRFVPGFFGPYYLDERLIRSPQIKTKAEGLVDDTLNGVFGSLGFDIAGILLVDGSYQYMKGSSDISRDQRFELNGSIGQAIVGKIPKVKKLEFYLYKTHIGTDIADYDSTGPVLKNGHYTYDRFFQKTPFLYYGYRVGFEITNGATLICDNRFGWSRNSKGELVPDNNITVQTAFTF